MIITAGAAVFINPTSAWESRTCNLFPKEGRIIITFPAQEIVAHKSEAHAALGPVSAAISEGIYRITMVSFDNHELNDDDDDDDDSDDNHKSKQNQAQPNEQWRLMLKNESGGTVGITHAIGDIPDNDNLITQVVHEHFSLTQSVSSVLAFHAAYPSSNPNGVWPVCAAFDKISEFPVVATRPATGVGLTEATINGHVDPKGGSDTTRWFEWGTTSILGNPTPLQSHGMSPGRFSAHLTGLAPDTTYHFRAHAKNFAGSARGDILTFTTKKNEERVMADIKANGFDGPITISHNGSAIISWSSQHATSCTVSPHGWTGTGGSQSTGNLTSERTYTLRCTGPGGEARDDVTVRVQALDLPSVTFIANPSVINAGGFSILSWTSLRADICTASNGWSGGRVLVGSQSVSPSQTTTYSIICSNAAGSVSDTATVTVQSDTPPSVSIVANPSTIIRGHSSVLSWSSQNATSCTASNGWSGGKVLSGTQSVTPTITTSYTITCIDNQGRSATDSTVVTVQENQQFPTATLTANPNSISQGGTSILSWSSQNANSCTASNGWSGGKAASGSETVSPSQTTIYSITCTGQYGSASDSEVVAVSIGEPLTIAKTARNVTLNRTDFHNSLEAQGGDILEFEIRIRNLPSGSVSVTVKDSLPGDLYYIVQSTTINSIPGADGIASTNGLTISPVHPQEEKIIKFRVGVFANATQKLITNQVSGTIAGNSKSSSMNIQIRNRGSVLGAATIVTGPGATLSWLLVLSFIGAVGVYGALFRYRYAGSASFASAWSDFRLQWHAWRIRRKEHMDDTPPYDDSVFFV